MTLKHALLIAYAALATSAALAQTHAPVEGTCAIEERRFTLKATMEQGRFRLERDGKALAQGTYDAADPQAARVRVTLEEGSALFVETLDDGHLVIRDPTNTLISLCARAQPVAHPDAALRERLAQRLTGSWGAQDVMATFAEGSVDLWIDAEAMLHEASYAVLAVNTSADLAVLELVEGDDRERVLVRLGEGGLLHASLLDTYRGVDAVVARLEPAPDTDAAALESALAPFLGSCEAIDDLVVDDDGPAVLTLDAEGSYTYRDGKERSVYARGGFTPVETTPDGVLVGYRGMGKRASRGQARLARLDDGSVEVHLLREPGLDRGTRRCRLQGVEPSPPGEADLPRRAQLEAQLQGDWQVVDFQDDVRMRFRAGKMQLVGVASVVSNGTYRVEASREGVLWIVVELDGKAESLSGHARLELSPEQPERMQFTGAGRLKLTRAPALPTAEIEGCDALAQHTSPPRLCAKGIMAEWPGTVTPYPVEVKMTDTCTPNTSCGEVTYSSELGPLCTGELHFMGGDGERFCFREIMPEGSDCISGATVLLRKKGDAWRWLWEDRDGTSGVSAWSELEACP